VACRFRHSNNVIGLALPYRRSSLLFSEMSLVMSIFACSISTVCEDVRLRTCVQALVYYRTATHTCTITPLPAALLAHFRAVCYALRRCRHCSTVLIVLAAVDGCALRLLWFSVGWLSSSNFPAAVRLLPADGCHYAQRHAVAVQPVFYLHALCQHRGIICYLPHLPF